MARKQETRKFYEGLSSTELTQLSRDILAYRKQVNAAARKARNGKKADLTKARN